MSLSTLLIWTRGGGRWVLSVLAVAILVAGLQSGLATPDVPEDMRKRHLYPTVVPVEVPGLLHFLD